MLSFVAGTSWQNLAPVGGSWTTCVLALVAGLSKLLHTAFRFFCWPYFHFGGVATLDVNFPTSCYVIPLFILTYYGVLFRRSDDWRRVARRCFASVVAFGIPSVLFVL
jgi:hypothetical protein